jgi:hypothetical protein
MQMGRAAQKLALRDIPSMPAGSGVLRAERTNIVQRHGDKFPVTVPGDFKR